MGSKMATVFDGPQWSWREQNDSDPDPIRIVPVCDMLNGMRRVADQRVCVPSEFYHYMASTHGSDTNVTGFNLQSVAGGRYYFSYDYVSPHERGTVTLWYYTPSNLPFWAKRYFK